MSELDPKWAWLKHAFADRPELEWLCETDRSVKVPHWVPRAHSVARIVSGWRVAGHSTSARDVLVTHGPRPTLYGAIGAAARGVRAQHLSFLNFTDLPTGAMRRAMSVAFARVDRFAVFSTLERRLYADYFGLSEDRFDMVHWGVSAPEVDWSQPPETPGDYVCALGSQARDYATLIEAMRALPDVRLVIVATRESLGQVDIPKNVTVLTNIPLARAMNILAHSRFMALPLRGEEVPCGHVTLVSAMHLGKAVVCTNSSGVLDYVFPGKTGHLVPPRDAEQMAAQVDALFRDPEQAKRLGLAGQAFAAEHCTERHTVQYFERYLRSLEERS